MKKAAVFILLGQSNAVGHNLPMEEHDKILMPLSHVFGLSRAANQSYDNTKLTWGGYTSHSMNLAEEQDHTYSIANCLARQWQDAIGDGQSLPDLYIVQIAIGAQGVTENYMWHPQWPKVLKPGRLGTVNIALTPFTTHILSLLKDSIRARGAEPEIIGIHWRGGENDFYDGGEVYRPVLKSLYTQIFGSFYEALGEHVPTILHRLVCFERPQTAQGLDNLHFINKVFDELAAELPNISVFDVRQAPYYTPGVPGDGLFKADFVHFTRDVNQWVAHCILRQYTHPSA